MQNGDNSPILPLTEQPTADLLSVSQGEELVVLNDTATIEAEQSFREQCGIIARAKQLGLMP